MPTYEKCSVCGKEVEMKRHDCPGSLDDRFDRLEQVVSRQNALIEKLFRTLGVDPDAD